MTSERVSHREHPPAGEPEMLRPERPYQTPGGGQETVAEVGAGRCFHELFQQHAIRVPGSVAAVCDSRTLSYSDLDARSNQVARYLNSLNVGPDSLVGLCMERSLDLVVGLLGILKAGGAYVPMDPSYPTERLGFIVEDADVSVLLTQRAIQDRLPTHRTHVICLDSDWPIVAREPTDSLNVSVHSGNLAYVIYTSGSTGQPKGTMIEHGGLTNYLLWAARTYWSDSGAGSPVHTSISFDLTVTSLLLPLAVGGWVDLLPESRGASALAERIQAGPAYAVIKLTPAHLDLLRRQLESSELLDRHSTFVIGGEQLLAESLAFWREHLPSARFINEYGPTETVVGCCVYELSADTSHTGPVPIGRPIANTTLSVVDELMQPVAGGSAGELIIGGAGVARGYLNRSNMTAAAFLSTPSGSGRLYRTGDLVRYLPDGDLEFLGRIDQQIKLQGYRIEPGDIEAALMRHPRIRQTAVTLRGETLEEKHLAAYFVADGRAPSPSELRAYLRVSLPEHMIPTAFVPMKELPLTANGKVDRSALSRVPIETRQPADRQGTDLPSIERWLVDVWERLLDTKPILVTDDFFALGGHSLLVIRLLQEVEQTLGITIPVKTVLERPTIEALARAIVENEGDTFQDSMLIRIERQGSKTPFFYFDGDVSGDAAYSARLARHLGDDQPFYTLKTPDPGGLSTPTIEEMARMSVPHVQQIQPRGPYILGGFCHGGYVALELARLLHAAGEDVPLVIMLHTPVPGSPGPKRKHRIVSTLGHVLGMDKHATLDLYLALRSLKALRRPSTRGRSRSQRAVWATDWIVSAYDPAWYDNSITLLWGLSESGPHEDLVKGWAARAAEVRIRLVPGGHSELVERIADVAEAMAQYLRDAQAHVSQQTAASESSDTVGAAES